MAEYVSARIGSKYAVYGSFATGMQQLMITEVGSTRIEMGWSPAGDAAYGAFERLKSGQEVDDFASGLLINNEERHEEEMVA